MTQNELMKKIQQLSFVKTELELFLDTHPNSKIALEHYMLALDELKMLKEQYAQSYGPIVAADANGEMWAWVGDVWPWHHEFAGNPNKDSFAPDSDADMNGNMSRNMNGNTNGNMNGCGCRGMRNMRNGEGTR